MNYTIRESIEHYISTGMTVAQARSFTAQQIILSKIESSPFVDKVLLKGGVVMYNITQEQRRSTLDLDFDFLRYDIRDENNIKRFIESLNIVEPNFHIEINGPIEELHQQDYKGKRVKLIISDETEKIRFKIDIGIHTLLAINQNKMCFTFLNDQSITLLVNPPEQIIAEKLFSLAKIGPTSQRYKDIDDIYYLLVNAKVDIRITRECLSLLTINSPYGMRDIYDVAQEVENCLNNLLFSQNYKENGAWLGVEYNTAKKVIVDFIFKL